MKGLCCEGAEEVKEAPYRVGGHGGGPERKCSQLRMLTSMERKKVTSIEDLTSFKSSTPLLRRL